MLNKTKALITMILIATFLAVPASAVMLQDAADPADPAEEARLVAAMPRGDGRGLVRDVCVVCHKLKQVLIEKRNTEEWELTVDAMNARGAALTLDEFKIVVSYLVEHYGPE